MDVWLSRLSAGVARCTFAKAVITMVGSNSRLALNDFMSRINEAISRLRGQLRSKVSVKAPSIPMESSSLHGDVFVESVGSVVSFFQGNVENIYTPQAVKLRDRKLGMSVNSRRHLFGEIAQQFQSASRILNIGAGGDVVPIKAMQAAGHEVVATDFAEDTIGVLRERVSAPMFACNLVHLSKVLPEPVDYLIGNSTLGYIDPNQARSILDSVYSAMERGAIFTFDMMPHGAYFNIADQAGHQAVANESAASPRRFLSFLDKYGCHNGVNAFAFHEFFYPYAIGLALVGALRKEFEERGAKCATGSILLREAGHGREIWNVLRVSKGDERVLMPVDGETPYDDPEVMLQNDINSAIRPYSKLLFIDRKNGEALARSLGIHQDSRRDPWLVAEYFAEHQDAASLPEDIRRQVASQLSPSQYMARILPYIKGDSIYRPPMALDSAVAKDQTIHKLVLAGEMPMGRDEADRFIDQAYATKAATVMQKREEKILKQKRKRQQSARRKNK